jgi:hypothetical protein
MAWVKSAVVEEGIPGEKEAAYTPSLAVDKPRKTLSA